MATQAPEQATATRGRILVVDDEAPVRRVIRQALEKHGYDVVEAPDGRVAIRVLENECFDVLITDIVMPEGDGLETILHLRRQHGRIKTIAISAPSNQLFLESARGLGADCVFVKPLSLEELVAAVQNLLAGNDQPS